MENKLARKFIYLNKIMKYFILILNTRVYGKVMLCRKCGERCLG